MGCGFHPGGQQIAYLRADQLWVVNPDGSDARQLAPRQILSFSWSPDHHEVVFRYGASAGPPATRRDLGARRERRGARRHQHQRRHADADHAAARGLARSDAWWDPQGNRLLYREYTPAPG